VLRIVFTHDGLLLGIYLILPSSTTHHSATRSAIYPEGAASVLVTETKMGVKGDEGQLPIILPD
jgi:hypothetical protein